MMNYDVLLFVGHFLFLFMTFGRSTAGYLLVSYTGSTIMGQCWPSCLLYAGWKMMFSNNSVQSLWACSIETMRTVQFVAGCDSIKYFA